eukprot:NODE_12817_length_1201_cov_14.277467.p1 GENE.NODE_12817_length_1201_cov_14.277467~~NODE_12817_length_1201_cov_14.277467.p1  ORF type:complete len:281 (+),score=83.28 NODE_12817_length_1201_cov_14.277467:108-950(+)
MAMPCCPPGSLGALTGSPGNAPRGRPATIGPVEAYISEPTCEGADATKCVVLLHDIFGFRSGRHDQIADYFAEQGWLCVAPDFYYGEEAPFNLTTWGSTLSSLTFGGGLTYVWRVIRRYSSKDTLRAFYDQHLLPWLRARGVNKVQWFGICWGAYGGAYLSQADGESELARMVIGSAAAHSSLHSLSKFAPGDSYTTMANALRHPVLFFPTSSDPAAEKEGGELEVLMAAAGQTIKFHEFAHRPHGWTSRGDFDTDEDFRKDYETQMSTTARFMKENFDA